MFGWRPIAAFEEVQAARARLWGADARRSDASWATVGGLVPVGLAVGRYAGTAQADAFPAAQEAPYSALKGPMPEGKTEKPPGMRCDDRMHEVLAGGGSGKDSETDRMAKYLSREWVEAGRAHVEKDDRFAQLTRGVRASVLCVVHDVPDHADEVFYISFDDGRIIDLYSGDKRVFDSLGKMPSFEVHGDYDTYMKIQEGHLTQTTAVMRGMLKLKGSWLKALRYIRALEELTTILREVPTEY